MKKITDFWQSSKNQKLLRNFVMYGHVKWLKIKNQKHET